MDLGIHGRKALVCGASKGLGKSCAMSLAREGVSVTLVARTKSTLEATADEIRRVTNVSIHWVQADVTTDEGRQAAIKACPEPDILVNNAGGPPPGNFRDWDRAAWIEAIDANMLSAIFLIRAVLDGMIARRFWEDCEYYVCGGQSTEQCSRAFWRRSEWSDGIRSGLGARTSGCRKQCDREQPFARSV